MGRDIQKKDRKISESGSRKEGGRGRQRQRKGDTDGMGGKERDRKREEMGKEGGQGKRESMGGIDRKQKTFFST